MHTWQLRIVRRMRRTLLALSLLSLATGCASSSGAAASRRDGATAPERIGRDIAPDLAKIRFDALSTVVDLSVMVDQDARADMATLRIGGTANVSLRDAYREWIGNGRFTPASAGGQVVRGEYRYRLQVGTSAPVI